ncbi:MAG: sulfite exporter TauE/SafE family protein [Solirubrobacterales bacterium]|nr:sulfite exporter TauE/SafE family protein [Solirubrobacterales bacterium]
MCPLAHKRLLTCKASGVPSYVQASVALAGAVLLLATVLPAPRLHPARLAPVVLCLMAASATTFLLAFGVIVAGVLGLLQGSIVIVPALAGLGLAVTLCLTMCWVVSAAGPVDAVAAGDEEPEEDEGGGGGGGLRPEDDPPRDPGPTDGICWDAFDRDRQAWESLRPVTERELADA